MTASDQQSEGCMILNRGHVPDLCTHGLHTPLGLLVPLPEAPPDVLPLVLSLGLPEVPPDVLPVPTDVPLLLSVVAEPSH